MALVLALAAPEAALAQVRPAPLALPEVIGRAAAFYPSAPEPMLAWNSMRCMAA